MSSNYWQTKRQTEQFAGGHSTTQKAKIYCQKWEGRCYRDGIPDDIPRKIFVAGRAPSYRAIAVCILQNDLKLFGLGFVREENTLSSQIYKSHKDKSNPQIRLM